jgi:hypothetical protein
VDVSKTFYVTERKDWRKWPQTNHATESEIRLALLREAPSPARRLPGQATAQDKRFGMLQ